MNGQPHTHDVEIRRGALGNWLIRYGTTKVRFALFFEKPWKWPKERQNKAIARALAKAVKSHDHGSIRAASRVEPSGWRNSGQREAIDQLFPVKVGSGEWAVKFLKEPVNG